MDSELAGGDYTIQGTTTFEFTADRTANTIIVDSPADETIALNGYTLSLNGLLNRGKNGNQGSILTVGTATDDGNLTAVTGQKEFVLSATSNIIVNSNIIDNDTAVILVKAGMGDLTLAGSNTSTGGIAVAGLGSLIVASSSALGTGTITLNSGAVQFANGIAANTVITNNWVVTNDAAIEGNANVSGLSLTGSISINDTATLYWVEETNQGRLINSAISGMGNLDFLGDNAVIAIGGTKTNTYSGLTSISSLPDNTGQTIVSLEKTNGATAISGNILLGSSNLAFPSTPQQEILILNQGGVINYSTNQIADTSVITFQGGNGSDAGVFQLNNNSETIGGIQSSTAGDGVIENNSNISGTSVLNVSTTAGAAYTYSGVLLDHDPGNNNAGTLALIKSGSGDLTLRNNSSYSGGTRITAGSLYVNNDSGGSATGSGTVSVDHGATLGGNGFLNNTSGAANLINGNVAVGQLMAGDSNTNQVLTIQSSAGTIFNGANLTFNLSTTTPGQGNQLAAGSSPNVLFNGSSNTLTFDLQGSGIIPDATQYTLFTSTTTGTNLGGSVFGGTGLALGPDNVLSGLTLDFVNGTGASYTGTLTLQSNGMGGYNIDLNIATVAVPEPGAWALMLGGLALLLVCQRARRFYGHC